MSCSGQDIEWMRVAMKQAARAGRIGEVPVGAVVVFEGRIIGRGFNQPIRRSDPSAHAEIIAMRKAAAVLGNYRLTGCDLVVTLEPCLMCAGAMIHARIRRLVIGALDGKGGAVLSNHRVLESGPVNHRFEVVCGVLEEECREQLQAFFRQLRKK
jgi:tRNA(adenine34) deaminase